MIDLKINKANANGVLNFQLKLMVCGERIKKENKITK
jgi:hypothetical protein